ncbi:hypothetical protein [Dyella caseinilytica]|uniref:Uncharacterized protein n=1 Tax=Dyella caseinilytica TaxID=1849581 RepID=A0ABX7GPN2_9GAMM|nr:hypothetical protein [Dyella caseinilytica]QRN52352.1 hypothetical protein ISN74_12755 [Dyella caseinilytica]GGA15018.1 hypothetical protein GCM10011408_41240 [Dyella caseinilytica]
MKRKLLTLMLLMGFAGAASADSISTGNVLVIDQEAGTNAQGALFVVDQNAGTRTLFSDFGNSSQGATGVDPAGIAWLPGQLLGLLSPASVLVTDGSAGTGQQGALFQIDPTTGNRTLLSDFGNSAQGTLGEDPVAVLPIPVIPGLLNSGIVLAVDPFAGTNGQGAIFSVDASGNRTVLTDFGDSTGPQGQYPDSLAYYPGLLGLLGTTVLVADGSAGTNGQGELFSVNPATGVRAVLSDFGNSAQGWVDANPQSTPYGVIVSPTEQIFVLVQELSAGGGGAVIQVDPSTGNRTLVSSLSCTNSAGATVTGVAPYELAWLPSGLIGVSDSDAGTNGDGAVFTVNPANGQCQVFSDFGSASQGALGSEPSGITVAQ